MSLHDDIARLTPANPANNRLNDAVPPRAIREGTGLQLRARAGGAETNSEEITVQSTDGLFTFMVRVLKS